MIARQSAEDGYHSLRGHDRVEVDQRVDQEACPIPNGDRAGMTGLSGAEKARVEISGETDQDGQKLEVDIERIRAGQ